jgi:hypothetical protein
VAFFQWYAVFIDFHRSSSVVDPASESAGGSISTDLLLLDERDVSDDEDEELSLLVSDSVSVVEPASELEVGLSEDEEVEGSARNRLRTQGRIRGTNPCFLNASASSFPFLLLPDEARAENTSLITS